MVLIRLKTRSLKESRTLFKQGFIPLFIALIALSFAAIFLKLSEQEIGPNATVFNRLWIAAIVLGSWNWIDGSGIASDGAKEKQLPKNTEILLLILVGIIGTASVICWAWSLTQTSVANSTLMRNLSPFFTCVVGWLFFKQKFDSRFIVGMLLTVIGGSLIVIGDMDIGMEHLKGDATGLLAALFYALNLLIIEYLRSRYSAIILLGWRCAIGAIATIPLVWLTEDKFFPHSLHGWLIIIGFAIICQCFGQCILIHNLKHFSSGFIAVFLLLEPTFTAIFAWLIFGETLTALNLLAFVIILIGIFFAKTSQSSNRQTL